MGKVSSSFLKEMKPAYCGDASYSRSYPWCKKDPEAINLTAYKKSEKYWDILPLHTGDAVTFCRHFQSSIFGDSKKHCVALTKDFRAEIRKIIAAMPGKETVVAKDAKSVIPTGSKLRRMITDGTNGSALSVSTTFDTPYDKKAGLIREKLVEIAALKISGDAAMDSKILKLDRDINRVCIVSNPDALTRINDDCAGVIENNESMKGWLKSGAAAIGTLFTTFFLLVKTGKLPKMWTAGKNQWKYSRAGDPENDVKPDNFIWASIKAIGAFFTANDPYAETVDDGIVTDGTVDGSGDSFTNEEIENMLNDVGPIDKADEATTPDPAELYSYGGSAEALDNYLAKLTKVRSTLSSFEQAVEDTGDNLRVVPNSPFSLSSLSKIGDYLEAAIDSTGESTPNARFAKLLANINSGETLATLKALNVHHTKWSFDHILPFIIDKFEKLRKAMVEGDEKKIEASIRKINLATEDLNRINTGYGNFIGQFYDIIDNARKNTSFTNPKDSAHLGLISQSAMYARGLRHDIGNIMTATKGTAQLIEGGNPLDDDINFMLDVIKGYDLSILSYNLKTAVGIQRTFAGKMGVTIELSDKIPHLENMDNETKYFIFNATNEVLLNAIKYADREKPKRTVKLDAVLHDDNLIDLVFTDNGVGIRNTQKVLYYGYREKPELAEGTGIGLSAIFDRSNKMGVTLSIESTPGEGTTISLKNIDVSGCTKSNPSGGSDDGGSKGTMTTSGSPSDSGTTEDSRLHDPASMKSSSFWGFVPRDQLGIAPPRRILEEEAPSPLDLSTSIFTGQGQTGIVAPLPLSLGVPATGAVAR